MGKAQSPLLFLFVLFISCQRSIGVFHQSVDVGAVNQKGYGAYDATKQEYRISASGENIWADKDAFHFLYQPLLGDMSLMTEVQWQGEGKNNHRKAGIMVRTDLSSDAPYADAVVHGDGLISLQYRLSKGGQTLEAKSPFKGPATLKLERHGDLFTLSAAKPNSEFQPIANILVPLPESVLAGLVVCSHDNSVSETARFTKVKMDTLGVKKPNSRKVESTLEVLDLDTGERKVVYRANDHFEAPNWYQDQFIFNSHGKLYTVPVSGGSPTLLPTGAADKCNNDHGVSFDGTTLAISSSHFGSSQIFTLPVNGGEPELITPLAPSYWHGWSPDGKYLAYCANRNEQYDVYIIPSQGGKEIRLTTAAGLDDGPEYSPDGKYIYFNSERSGLMKIWRMRPDGSGQEPVTTDSDFADWFAHPSPDGQWIVFLSYLKDVKGHPANQPVCLRLMPLSGGEPKVLARFFGGQGTINVPSWSADSKYVAFVSYRLN